MPELDSDHVKQTVLARYFAGQCSGTESARIAAWIAADPARQHRVEALRAEWRASGFLLDAPRVDALWQRLESHLPSVEPVGVQSKVDNANARPRALVWRVAAAVALTAGAAGLWRFVENAAVARSSSLAAAPASGALDAPRGRRVHTRLPDGTEVILGPASTMRYAVAADRGPRDVWLDGSGYFVVKHDAARPFVVRTAYGVMTDLGTRFAVRAYSTDSVTRVAVAEGKVSLRSVATAVASATADSLVLTPGDRGRATAAGRIAAERGAAIDHDLAWIEGRLDFEDMPLAAATADIGRWYDLDVRLADSTLGRRQLSASFRTESADDVLRAIAASAGVAVERRGRVVTFRAHR